MELSIIIINFNTSQLTLDCVQSIKEKTNKQLSYEIIIVDNNSSLEDYKLLKMHLPENIKLIRSVVNSGFSGGNMLGVNYATGDYLAFINSDVVFIEDCLAELKTYMDNNYKTAVCSPIQLSKDLKPKKSFDHHHGIRKKIFGRWFLETFCFKPKRGEAHNHPIKVDAVQGSFMFFRSDYFAEVGGFDTNIFLYYEEIDICKRLKNKGYDAVHLPTSRFIHYEGSSTDIGYLKEIETQISYLYVLRKNFGYPRYLLIKYLTLIVTFFKACFRKRYWKLFFTLLTMGSPLAHSLKHKQTINFK